MTKVLLPAHCRWANRRDLPAILDIEEHNHAYYDDDFDVTTSQAICWDERDFLRELRRRQNISAVLEVGDGEGNTKTIGYVIYSQHKSHLEILKFGIHPEYQRRGYGTTLMHRVHQKLGRPSIYRDRIVYYVREDARSTQEFLKSLNFKSTVARRYWDDGSDAYCFTYYLDEEKAKRKAA